MSVKKILVLTAAGLVAIGATAAMAGGPDHMAMPSEPAFQNSIYLEGHVGYTQSNWTNFNGNQLIGQFGSGVSGAAFTPANVGGATGGSNGNGGVTGGADLGYNITQHIAVEAGWFYIPQVTGGATGDLSSVIGSTATVNSWFAYMAGKLSVPVMDNLDLFGKIGVAYRSLSYSLSNTTVASLNAVSGNGGYWAPVFGAGIQYLWGSWIVGGQYMYLPGNSAINNSNASFGAPNAAPEINQYTGFLGYKFNV
ncbi:MAG: hypothetical protein A3E82_05515 [Gammaproteobacteria bacterium RIFCSPHIGHO2_12_FULL_38_11]|nr:MAG: hypothetical protein A3E82_05515 [Gammaproteobacteria bacterium RIFCSPHIGHO2_12_FULL_38_11]